VFQLQCWGVYGLFDPHRRLLEVGATASGGIGDHPGAAGARPAVDSEAPGSIVRDAVRFDVAAENKPRLRIGIKVNAACVADWFACVDPK